MVSRRPNCYGHSSAGAGRAGARGRETVLRNEQTDEPAEDEQPTRKLKLGSREYRLPQNRPLRIGLGGGLVLCGVVGFLPVVGFWMIPLGLLVLSQDLPVVRRWRRKLSVRFGRWKNGS